MLYAKYSFSLSSLFEFTNTTLKIIITKNKTTKYPGIIAKFFNTFEVLSSLNPFDALIAEKIITKANIK